MKPYLLNDVPEDLWEALRSDASSRETPAAFVNEDGRRYPPKRTERTGTSLNNVVCEILAARYVLEFEPTNRATFDQAPVNRSLYLRLPEFTMEAVEREAVESGLGQKRAVILHALAEHYMLSVPASVPKPKRKRVHGRPRGRRKVKR